MRIWATLIFLPFLFSACGEPAAPVENGDASVEQVEPDASSGHPDAAVTTDAGAPNDPDSGTVRPGPTIVPAGNVSGAWSGEIRVEGAITVAAGDTLSIAGGTSVNFTGNFGIEVAGTVLFESTGSMIAMSSAGAWSGIRVATGGTLSGAGLSISGAQICLTGLAGSTIDLESSAFTGCTRAMRLANGGNFSRVIVLGGNTLEMTGGHFQMTDSTIDFMLGENGPDCTDWDGGTATIDHSRFTGCHCPLHFNRTDGPVLVTNSIFDDGANAVMIARSNATFTGNHFDTSQAEFLDIGGSIAANIAGNYWGGGAPIIATGNQSQFTGAGDFLTQPIPGVGPR
jgi:hypothetical protein